EILAPASDAYGFTATRSDGRIVLSGEVPNLATRERVRAAATTAFPDTQIVDEMVFASGAPDGYAAQVQFSLSQLGAVEAGDAGFTPGGFFLNGQAKDMASFDAAGAALGGAMPGEMTLASNGLTPPVVSPYTWSAVSDENGVELSGFVPSEDVRSALVEKASEISGSVTDNMLVALGAPTDFSGAAAFGLDQLSGLSSGTASLSDNEYSITGKAADSAGFEAESGRAVAPPSGFATASSAIEPPVVADYPFRASLEEEALRLTGFAPTNEARQNVETMAAAKFPDVEILNELQIAAGAPAAYEAGVGYGLDMLTRFDSGQAELVGDQLSVVGSASTVSDYTAATAQLGTFPAGLTEGVMEIEPAIVSPYQVTMVRNGQATTLTGFAPDLAARTAAEDLAAVTFPDATIVNRLQIAGGVPDGVDYAGALIFATDQLAKLETGTATLNDDSYSITGAALTEGDYDSVIAEVSGDLPAGLSLGSQDVRLPLADPFIWSAMRNGNGVVLSGNVPSNEEKERLTAYANSRFSGLEITSDMTRAAGEPRNFDSAASVGLTTLSRMRSGSVTLEGSRMIVEGETFTPVLRDELTSAIANGLPAGFTGEANLTAPDLEPVEADLCDALIAARMSEAKIGFETAKAVIRAESFGLLDELSGIVARCEGTRLEIAGHTDSDGSETYNQRLSEARANAVRTYMVEAGVEALRIRARGFGEAQPIADNDSDEGKAQNRRIEFKIVE
ncbi:MAG: OmpA family protein, partial [Pseudomonadota bacterium]